MKRILTTEIIDKFGEEVELSGWVHKRRDHGKIIFIDLRDRGGIAQLVFTPAQKDYKKADTLRSEWVIEVRGVVKKRPTGMENKDLATGEYEVEVIELEILAESKTPPFDVGSDGYEINEEVRMRYRYLDLRRERLQRNLRVRSGVVKFIRDFLSSRDFVEIETPILTKSTPEGARDYLVPSRLQPGSFYALPQSPQQYKQLLMVAGWERYFQIARCFRDEDTRGDRQPEFTQLDLEMSFAEREDVMSLNEELLIELVSKCAPHKKIQEIPFPRLSYQEAIDKYGTDTPDLRADKKDSSLLAFVWIVDFPLFKQNEQGKITFSHNPFSAPKPEHMADLLNWRNCSNEDILKIISSQYDIVLNGWEIGGGSIRNHQSEALQAVFNILGYDLPVKAKIVHSQPIEFKHMFDAMDYGAPPHGGIAWGLDRLMMILQNEPNIREVIAFPKTGDGRDLMMDAPSEADAKQLEELRLKISE